MGVIDFVFYFLGAGVMFGVGRVVTSYPWHDSFHRNGPRYLLFGRAICAHCVRERIACLTCGYRPCLCAARREAQAWVAAQDEEAPRD